VRARAKNNPVPGTRPARATDQASVESQIQALASMDLASLRDRWRRTFGRQAPSGLGRDFMVRVIAYHVQAEALGDLEFKTIRTLAQLAAGDTSAITRDRTPGRNLHPGTELVREYQGKQHRVTVLCRGFEWNGATYTTLSGVARAITGSNWNGYAFFGLTERRNG
jgi:hypothetical protein